MALKRMHPEIMPWQMRMLENVRNPEILALFAGLVDFRRAAGRWLAKAISAVDKDFENLSGPVRLWFRTQKPTPYDVIKGLLPKPPEPPPPKKKEPKVRAKPAPAQVQPESAPAPAPAAPEPAAGVEPPAEEPPKKTPRKRKSKSA
jgi:hypothetical protein